MILNKMVLWEQMICSHGAIDMFKKFHDMFA